MIECDSPLKDLLPDVVAGRVTPEVGERVLAHARTCADCRADLGLIQLVRESRAAMPAELRETLARLVARAKVRSRQGRRVPRWALATAAGVVIALGAPTLLSRVATNSGDAELEAVPSYWLSEDALVAGGPVFDGLSDEALAMLLEELGG